MKKLLILALLWLCTGGAILAQQVELGGFIYGGVWRSYRLYLPASYTGDTLTPLVLNLHGAGSNALEQEVYGGFMPIADTAGFLIVSPDGILNTWNAGFVIGGTDDLGFLTALIDRLAADHPIDPARVYSTGMSNGGFMSHYLACMFPGRFAAIGPVAGTMSAYVITICQPGRPMPVIHVHGTDDTVVPYDGNDFMVAADSVALFWAGRNVCTTADTTDLPNTVLADLSTVTRIDWEACDAGADVTLLRVNGGGHTWPGSVPIPFGITNYDIYASGLIWDFFRRHPHPSPDPFGTTALGDEMLAGWQTGPNPFGGELALHYAGPGMARAAIYDMQGRLCGSISLQQGESVSIPTADWARGVYVLDLAAGDRHHWLKLLH
ncbi:MAG: hypothetical protein OHK0039_03770 [Bacteroidia bacterium]